MELTHALGLVTVCNKIVTKPKAPHTLRPAPNDNPPLPTSPLPQTPPNHRPPPPHLEVGQHDALTDLLQHRGLRKQGVVHAARHGGEEARGCGWLGVTWVVRLGVCVCGWMGGWVRMGCVCFALRCRLQPQLDNASTVGGGRGFNCRKTYII